MAIPEADQRSKERRTLDEQIAAEPKMPPLELPPNPLHRPSRRILRGIGVALLRWRAWLKTAWCGLSTLR